MQKKDQKNIYDQYLLFKKNSLYFKENAKK